MVWLLDSRRILSANDHAMLAWFGRNGVRVLAALTKADTLARGERVEQERAIRGELGVDPDQVLLTSARTGDGIQDLRAAVTGLIAGLKR